MDKGSVLITGGAGFIGIHLLKEMLDLYPDFHFLNVDCLTPISNTLELVELDGYPNYTFHQLDICSYQQMSNLFKEHELFGIIHLAAETHVDSSISKPKKFVRTNVLGTLNLLELARIHCINKPWFGKFYQISTDEVFGHLDESGSFKEEDPYAPRSPYAASKASADHLVRAYHHTYGLPMVISHCTNNYGPFQHEEKFIPKIITNALKKEPIPIYGRGDNIRNWLFVEDHVDAIQLIYSSGLNGHTYNISGKDELTNLELADRITDLVDKYTRQPKGTSRNLITFVLDRPGHDFRYSLERKKIWDHLRWKPFTKFEEGLKKTVYHYVEKFLL